MQNCYHNALKIFSRVCAAAALLLAFALHSAAQAFPVDTILANGPRANRINFVYISDGYTSAELNTFLTNAKSINSDLFSQTPFAEYKSFFNAYTIQVPSPQSGAIHPGNAADESSSGGQPISNANNYFQSTFDYYQIHRLLVPQDNGKLYSVLTSNMPDYDQGFIVVNSPYYGGSGGAFATASTDRSSSEVAIHEIGHSFAGLADEYWAGDFYAAEKPNMTQDNNPATIKWKSWFNINDIGAYPYGGYSPLNTWYKPHQYCKMQFLGYPFCAVCTERFIDHIHELVNMVDSYLPATTTFTLTNKNDVSFSVNNLQNQPATITVKWYLNKGTHPAPIATNVSSITVPYASFGPGNNTITAEIVDSISISKSYLPSSGYVNTVQWTISNSTLPVVLKSFTGAVDSKNRGLLAWDIATPDDAQSFDLEKSNGKTGFTKLATITALPNSHLYNYTDPNLFAPYTYYRLAMKDRDGKINYSNTIKLSPAAGGYFYKVYQDAAGKNYHLACQVQNTAKIELSITTVNGVRILNKDFGTVGSLLDYDFDLHNQPAGVYFANIYVNGVAHTIKLLAN